MTHRILTFEEVERIQAIARENPKWDAIVSWFLSTACRRKEPVNTRWKDLWKEETRTNGTIVVWDVYGKGNLEYDLVVHEDTFEKVIRYRKAAGLAVEIDPNDETPVFLFKRHETVQFIRHGKVINTIGIRAGVPDLSPH